MSRRDFTNEELLLISRMNRFQLASWLNAMLQGAGKRRGEAAMEIIRGLQRALARYSEGVAKFDRVQDKMLAVLGKLEKWLRLEYVRVRTPEIIAHNPKLANNPPAVKIKIQSEWESWFKRRSY